MSFTKRPISYVVLSAGACVFFTSALFLFCLKIESLDFWESLYRYFVSQFKLAGPWRLDWNGQSFSGPPLVSVFFAKLFSLPFGEVTVPSAALRLFSLVLYALSALLLLRRFAMPRGHHFLVLCAPLFVLQSVMIGEHAAELFAASLLLYFFCASQRRNFTWYGGVGFSLFLVFLTHPPRLALFECVALWASLWVTRLQHSARLAFQESLARVAAVTLIALALLTLSFLVFKGNISLQNLQSGIVIQEWKGWASRYHLFNDTNLRLVAYLVGGGLLSYVVVLRLCKERLALLYEDSAPLFLLVAILLYDSKVIDGRYLFASVGWAPLMALATRARAHHLQTMRLWAPFESLFLALVVLVVLSLGGDEAPVIFQPPAREFMAFLGAHRYSAALCVTLFLLSAARRPLDKVSSALGFESRLALQACISAVMVLTFTWGLQRPFAAKLAPPPVPDALKDRTQIATVGLFLPSLDLRFAPSRLRHYAIGDARAFESEAVIVPSAFEELCAEHRLTPVRWNRVLTYCLGVKDEQ